MEFNTKIRSFFDVANLKYENIRRTLLSFFANPNVDKAERNCYGSLFAIYCYQITRHSRLFTLERLNGGFLPTTHLKKIFGRNFFPIFRSSSLIVPPPTPQSSTWGSPRSPGSRSLHLSPYHRSKESSPLKTGNTAIPTGPEMFTFPSVSDQARIDLKLILHFFSFQSHFFRLTALTLGFVDNNIVRQS